jgi:hypothetical protein
LTKKNIFPSDDLETQRISARADATIAEINARMNSQKDMMETKSRLEENTRQSKWWLQQLNNYSKRMSKNNNTAITTTQENLGASSADWIDPEFDPYSMG